MSVFPLSLRVALSSMLDWYYVIPILQVKRLKLKKDRWLIKGDVFTTHDVQN